MLRLVFRTATLVTIAVLGFFVLFPDSFEAINFLADESKSELDNRQQEFKEFRNTEGIVSNPCRTDRSKQPQYPTTKERTRNARSEQGGIPKLLINRDPAVFDVVCQGDVLHYKLYAEQVDRVMLWYENETTELGAMQMLERVPFETSLSFEIPTDWLGSSAITATGYVGGEVVLASSKVTFTVLNSTSGLAESTSESKSRLTVSSNIEIFDGTNSRAINMVRLIDDQKTLRLGRIQIELSNPVLEPSTIHLGSTTAMASVKYVTPAKRTKWRKLTQLQGTIRVGVKEENLLPIKVDFTAHDFVNVDAEQNVIFRVKGEAVAKIEDRMPSER